MSPCQPVWSLAMLPRCKNPYCGERLLFGEWVPLCLSCRWIAKWALALGGVLGGGLLQLWRVW